MKKLLLFTLLAIPSIASAAPGIIGEYFQLKEKLGDEFEVPIGQQPWLVRVDQQIDFPEVAGDFYGSKLENAFMVRWTGALQVDQAGEYQFHTHSDDGSRLYIGDRLVVDNWGPHSMTKVSAKATLAKGTHQLKVIFQEGGGGAGCIVGWTPPSGKQSPIPASSLSHDEAALKAIEWNPKPYQQAAASKPKPKKKKPAPEAGGGNLPTAFGNFIGTALRVGKDEAGHNEAYRAQVIRLNPEGSACAVFDADTMRMVAGWTEGGIKLQGLPFTGGHGIFPSAVGPMVFTTSATPGWAGPDGSFAEPRKAEDGAYPPLGPLPKAHAHYKGLYVNGDQVILKYTVGGDEILEMAALEDGVITRTIQGDFSKRASVSLGKNGTVAVASSGELTSTERGVQLDIAPGKQLIKIAYSNEMPKGELVDLTKLIGGGPARFTETVTTKGELAKDDPDASYVLDRLTVPYKNPYGVQMRIGGFDFFTSDPSKAAVCTWDGDVWIISGIDDKLENLTWKRFAAGGHETLGLTIVDDVIYTVADDQITRYHDLNGDGEADFYENFNNDWELTSGFHAFCFDLQTDPSGDFFFAFGSPVRGGGRSFERMSRHHGSIIKVSKDGSKLERYATGLRAPNGIGISPTGQLTSGDNEGTFVPRCPIHWIDAGEFLGVVDSSENWASMKTTPTTEQRLNDRKKHLEVSEAPMPLAWLPKQVDNSNGGQVWVTSDKWGPFEGEMLHMSYGQSALYVVLKEKKGALMQGGVVKIPVRPTSSAMRGKFNPRDGQLYIAGLKGWQTNAGREGGLDRVRYTGRPVAMPSSLNVRNGGIEIGFTQKLDQELAEDVESYSIKASDLAWTHDYGTREFEIGYRDSITKELGATTFEVISAKLLPDGKSVFIQLELLQPVHMMEIKLDLETEDGEEIVTKINNTIHVVE
ncbi:MAG: hypothetical protein ACI8XO_004625 [Verrucomicrobiales bacterium]|jgi:hypothetical protein